MTYTEKTLITTSEA